MMTSHDDKASNDDYEAVLVTENNKYYFHIKELQIIASGDTIESAHSELLRKKSDLIKDYFDERCFCILGNGTSIT